MTRSGVVSVSVAVIVSTPAVRDAVSVVVQAPSASVTPLVSSNADSLGGTTFTRLGAQIQPRRFLDFLDLAFDPNEPRRWLIATGLASILHDPGEPGFGHSIGGGPGTSATVEFAAGGAFLVGGFFGIQRSED